MGDNRLQPWDMAEATFGSGQGDLRRLAAGSWIACRDRCGESFMARMIVLHMASNVPWTVPRIPLLNAGAYRNSDCLARFP
jgi:hypothetical protein